MPVLFKNPDLPDYFLELPEVTAADPATIPSIVQPYESGRVIILPNLKFDIDAAFWAALPTDTYPELKKLPSTPLDAASDERDGPLENRLAQAGAPDALNEALRRETRRLYAAVLPVYEALFRGYRFTRKHAVWRLQTIMNENMHVDTYPQRFDEHFARLFINLDDQPRIWKTSWPITELYARYAAKVRCEADGAPDADHFRTLLNRQVFGAGHREWWDNEPRHVAYFGPGEVWSVDSRQVAHQIFYGRRALSVDFFVDVTSMRRPKRHYLAMAERLLRTHRLGEPAAAQD